MIAKRIQPLVSCRGVTRQYGSGERATIALRGADLDIYPGELTLLVGPSGCGQTTLISIISGILHPPSGAVLVADEDLVRMTERTKASFRAENVGIVFQHFNLIPTLTAAENVAVPLIVNRDSARRAVARAEQLLS